MDWIRKVDSVTQFPKNSNQTPESLVGFYTDFNEPRI